MSDTAAVPPSEGRDPSRTSESPAPHKGPAAQPNHNLTTRTMAGEEHQQPPSTQNGNDDPATIAASEELRQTTITDKPPTKEHRDTDSAESEPEGAAEDKVMHETEGTSTPPLLSDGPDEEMRERLSSPKKKRGRDQDDDGREARGAEEERGSSADGSVVNGSASRSKRLEPEKKRVRDGSEDRSSEVEATEVKKVWLPPTPHNFHILT